VNDPAAATPLNSPNDIEGPSDELQIFSEVCKHARGTAVLADVEALLGWDEQTMLPPAAAGYRGEQAAALASIVHERWIDPAFGDKLARLAEGPLAEGDDPDAAATIRLLRYDRDCRTRMPSRLVEELASTGVEAQQAWVVARRDSDWALLEPWLQRIFALKREQAACRRPDLEPYDALLDEYEPGGRAAAIAETFSSLREGLVSLLAQLRGGPRSPSDRPVRRRLPREVQEALVREVAGRIGFDFDRGRLDTTAHPFCTTIGPDDCRITTRWDEDFFPTSFFGVLHEAGHGLYEQGLRQSWHGLPPGEAASLGIHESQSRLWENLVGRSPAFWRWCLPLLRKASGGFADVSLEEMHEAMLVVRPSMIRVEADEVTYNLHVMLRFDLERAMVQGELPVADLPAAWNERCERDFGLRPSNAAEGVLQDIHWSAGLVGYFPTYTLGNLYAAQLMAAVQREQPGLEKAIAEGDFRSLLDWLRQRVHARGRLLESGPLVAAATGEAPTADWLLESLALRYGPAHGVEPA